MQLLSIGERLINAPLFRVENESISLLWLLKLALSFLIIVILAMLLKRLLKHRLSRRKRVSKGNQETIANVISSTAAILGFVFVLQRSGLNLTPLAILTGGLGIGVGLGLQDFAKNLLSGLMLLFEGKLQVDDYIEFDGLAGYIEEISMHTTIIRTPDGSNVVVPNSSLTNNRVLNWSYRNFRGKLHLSIVIANDSDPVLVTETLLNSAYMEPRVLHNPPPKVIFKGFAETTMEFELWAWVAQMDEGIAVTSSLNFIIEYNLRQIGLKAPLTERMTEKTTDKSVGQTLSIRDALRQLPHLDECSDLELRELIETGYRKFLVKSDVLFKEGTIDNHFYLILSGSIETTATQLNQTVKVYQAGEAFGEAAVMLNLPHTITARAVEDTSLFVFHKDNFEKLLHLHPKIAEVFTQALTKDQEIYQGVRQQLQDMGLLNAEEQHPQFANWVQTRLKNLFSA
jgi:potassium-dependent mechanosensitive channel